jgi:hypothetical protein
MNLPNFKKAKAGLLATLAIGTMTVASGFSPVNKIAGIELQKTAQAYQSWEHPFYFLGINAYSQATGDGLCWNQFQQMPISYTWTINAQGYYTRSFPEKRAWDGAYITNPRHVWYDRANGHCVANT